MTLKRIPEEELVAIRTDVYQDEDRSKYAGNCIVTAAQRQLEACQEAHNAVIREIFKEIEKYNQGVQIIIWPEDWQALKQKYGGE